MFIPSSILTLKETNPRDLALFQSSVEKLHQNEQLIYNNHTSSQKIIVTDNKIGRFLSINDSTQGILYNTSSYKGALPYLNYFLLSYLLNPNVENVLFVGMGTGTLAGNVLKLFPNIKHFDIVDIEPLMFDIAKNYFGFIPDERVKLHSMDGREFVKNSNCKYDLILSDVGAGEGLVYKFITQEYFENINRILNPDGIFMMNTFGSTDFDSPKNVILGTVSKTLKSVFSDVLTFRTDYGDAIFYKILANLKYRLLDMTNILFFAANKNFEITRTELVKRSLESKDKFDMIDVRNLNMYANNLYDKHITSENWKILKDEYLDDSEFTIDNFVNYLSGSCAT